MHTLLQNDFQTLMNEFNQNITLLTGLHQKITKHVVEDNIENFQDITTIINRVMVTESDYNNRYYTAFIGRMYKAIGQTMEPVAFMHRVNLFLTFDIMRFDAECLARVQSILYADDSLKDVINDFPLIQRVFNGYTEKIMAFDNL